MSGSCVKRLRQRFFAFIMYITYNLVQAFLWQGGSTHRLAANSPYYFAHTYPSVFGKEYSRSIVLSGFDFKINTIVNYQVDVFTSGSSVDTIRFKINEDLIVLSVSFHLVLVDTRSYWVWIETGSKAYFTKPTK